jgi:hypothetical protein
MREEISRPFRWSIRLTLAGLVVELLSLFRLHHPLGFMFFMGFGWALMGAGVLIFVYYMLSLVRPSQSRSSE